jgi:hypothetical protein
MVRRATAREEKANGKTGLRKLFGLFVESGSPVSSRRVCLVLNLRIAAAEISVRRLARTSERTSMRCSSRPLIVTKSNLCLPNLIFGRVVWTFQFCTNRTLQLCAYIPTMHKERYRNCTRSFHNKPLQALLRMARYP